MGRGIGSAPLDVQVVQQAFALRQDGILVRRRCHIDTLSGEPATFTLNGKLMVRIGVQGKVRRLMASRVAWAIAANEWPSGPVRPKNGDGSDLRADNLVQTRHGAHRPNAAGGRASSLERRKATNAALLNALAERANPTLAELSQAIGLSEGRVSARLNKLAAKGLALSPQCCPGRSWALTVQGRAAASSVVLLDDLDRRVLAALALTSMGTVKLARRVEVCQPTIRRRVRPLLEKGLVFADPRKFFSVTPAGRAALGDEAVVSRWVDPARISAANARDVRTRLQHPNDDRSSWARAEQSSRARQKGIEQARENGQQPFIDALTEFDRLRA
jgi:DNA-binding Lrp family transcriptional regulator